MKKLLLFSFLGLIIGIAGFFVYKQMNGTTTTPVATKPVSPVFSNLSTWVPTATWSTPHQTTEKTAYGELSGMSSEAKITGSNDVGNSDLHNQPFMQKLGFESDMTFAADGPGASNWGYKKTENAKMTIVIFSYSTQHLLGPETTVAPYVNLSVFVSDPFTKN